MVARDIVPFDAISVEIVQDANADFVAITVVRLSFGSRFLSVISKRKTLEQIRILKVHTVRIFKKSPEKEVVRSFGKMFRTFWR